MQDIVKAYFCKACTITFCEKCNIDAENLVRKQINSYACDVSPKIFSHQIASLHGVTQPRSSYRCVTCGKFFLEEEKINCSYSTHTNENLSCDIRDETFKRKKSLTMDQSTNSQEKEPIEGKAYRFECSLKHRYESHKIEKTYSSDICGEENLLKDTLDSHHTHTKPLTCVTHGKAFSCQDSLNAHKLQHTKEKPHLCDICGKEFIAKWRMKRHRLIHLNIKYSCNVCDKAFSAERSLNRHRPIHLSKKYSCNVCGEAFSAKGSLNCHKLIHLNKKYSCNVCGKAFSAKGSLNRHRLIHLNKKYSCNVCGKAYTDRSNLKRHSRWH